jgi:aminopeptidase N
VLDKWFSIQAMAAREDVIEAVRALYSHPDFDLKNPNRARSLIGAFASGNPAYFHDASGEGYRFLADAVIALDPINGSIAARLIGPLGQWRRQSAARGALMRRELQRVLDTPNLSKGTFEKASKALL